MIWSFLGFELDDQQCELRRGGAVIELRRKVFDVLRYLVTHSERLVSKDELLAGVWPGETIHEAVVAQNIAILRKVLDDSREAKRVIQTVHGRGYRFVANVTSTEHKPASSPAPPRPSAPSETPFVGRTHTLRELRKLLHSALSGRGQFALISGDAGIGKTRTAEELASEARALGTQVYEGRCYEGAGAPAYWPWIQILRAAAGAGQRAQVLQRLGPAGADVAQLVTELRGEFGGLPRPAPLDSAEARFRLFDGITSFLSELARAQPLVLIFDDLHRADEATLHLLRFLSREVQAQSLLVLATAREVDTRKEPATAALLTLLTGGTQVNRIYLSGLSQAATAELAASTEHRLGDEALRELHTLTEGNPFFVHQVLRLFADDGSEPGTRKRLELPNRVREIIALRMHGLDPRAQRLLALASVIGRSFNVAVLEQIAGLARAELLELIEAAVAARIVRESGDASSAPPNAPAPVGQYEFAHALIREHLYGALKEGERVQLHEQAGRALEARFGVDAEAHLSELAYHFCRAAAGGEVERAVRYCMRAAEQALDQLAFEQAVYQYRSALEALMCRLPIDEQRRFELKLALGSALFRAGEDGNSALLGAAEIARRLEAGELLIVVALAMCGWPRFRRNGRTDNPELLPLIEEALQVETADVALRARLLSAHALNLPLETPLAEKRALSEQALVLARSAQQDEALYDALLSQLRLTQAPEHATLRLSIANELLEVAERIGQKERIFTAQELRIQPLLARCDLSTADAAIATCARLADELRFPRCRLTLLRLKLERALGDGRFDEIGPLTKQAVDVRGQAAISPWYLVSLYMWITFAREQRGERDWFERNIDAMTAAAEKSTLMRAHVAYAYATFGELERARDCYAPLLDPVLIEARDDDDWLLTMVLTADAAAACGDRSTAELLYPQLSPHAELNVTHFDWLIYLGSCAHWLGLLAAALGRRDAASAHFEAALATNHKLGAKPALARTSLAYARLLQHGAAEHVRGEGTRARKLLREAIAIGQTLGMRRLLEEARAPLE